MGRMLIEAVLQLPDATLVGALDHASCSVLGADAGAFLGKKTGVMITADLAQGLRDAEYLIDFTRPEGTMLHLAACTTQGVKMIIGTTGLSSEQIAQLKTASSKIAMVFAPNMSVGVNLAFKLVEVAAGAIGAGYDVEIVEAHHRNKVDAPSGTALRMGEIAARTLGRDHDSVAVFDRKGETGVRRDASIGYAVVRGGDLVGDHTVMFLGQGERIEITHKASSRSTYAQGALRACRFLRDSGAGLFDMHDVLGIR